MSTRVSNRKKGIIAFLTNALEEPRSGMLCARMAPGKDRVYVFFSRNQGLMYMGLCMNLYDSDPDPDLWAAHQERLEQFPEDAEQPGVIFFNMEAQLLNIFFEQYAEGTPFRHGRALAVRLVSDYHYLLAPPPEDLWKFKGDPCGFAVMINDSGSHLYSVPSKEHAREIMADHSGYMKPQELTRFAMCIEMVGLPEQSSTLPIHVNARVVDFVFDSFIVCGTVK